MTSDLAFATGSLPNSNRYLTSGEIGTPPFAGDKQKGPGILYAVQAVHGGPIKIGYCAARANLAQRVKSLQTGNPYQLQVVATIPGTPADERRLHLEFDRFRLSGEWFHPAKPIVAMFGGRASDTPSLAWVYERAWDEGWQVGFDDAARCERCGEKTCDCAATEDDLKRAELRDRHQAEVRGEVLSGAFYDV